MPRYPRRTTRRPRYARKAARLPRGLGKFMMKKRLLRKFPTFTETYKLSNALAPNVGGIFSSAISDLNAVQYNSYQALYRQYRINWVKFTVIPTFNSYDPNAATVVPAQFQAMPRMAWVVNDTPGLAPPATEAELLEDNGAKIKALVTKWSQSCKPVPDQTTGAVQMRRAYAPWLNFTNAAEPRHYGVSYYLTQNLAPGVHITYDVFVKINFSLRDPC